MVYWSEIVYVAYKMQSQGVNKYGISAHKTKQNKKLWETRK